MAQSLKDDQLRQLPGGIGNVTRPTCKHFLCTRKATLGSDFCGRHSPSPSIGPPNIDPIPNPRPQPRPSNDDLTGLERRMDRLEERMDKIIELLKDEDV